ncbi:unnamed protein product [Urochloa humidicola]
MEATRPLALTFFFCCILLETICCSGAFVELSYDSAQVKILSSSIVNDYRVMVTEKQHAYLFLKPFECRPKSCRPEHLAGSFVNEVLDPNRHLNVSNIIVTANERQLGKLHPTLQSVHASVGAAGLAQSVKVSPELMLSSLRIIAKHRSLKKQWIKVMEFVRRSGSLVHLEIQAEANSELAVSAKIQDAVADLAALSGTDAGVVLHLKSRATLSAEAMAKLVGDISQEKRLVGVLVDTPSPQRRELGEARATAHDEFSPVTNPAATPVTNPAAMPVTNPVTVPATNPVANPMSPGFVTVPSTNPGSGFTANPNLPPLYPEPTTTTPAATMPDPTTTTMPPATVPFANPVAAPTMPGAGSVTNPAAPVTNPATTPVTNPATTYPGGMPTSPVYQPPATMPGTVQPAAAGQTWCVAKTGMTDLELQNGIDYACGMGGADCSAIQPMGSCYNPNTIQAHASYAFNSYFQRNPSPTSCDFGGAGMLVNANPSSGTCMYQTSSGFGAGYSPGATGTVPTGYTPGMSGGVPAGYSPGWTGSMGGGSGSTVLNANNPGGNSMYGGSDNPTSLTAGSAPLSCGWVLCLIWMVTFAFVKEKV